MGAPEGTEITLYINPEVAETASDEELDAVAIFVAELWEKKNYG